LGTAALLCVALFSLRLWRRRHYRAGSGDRSDLAEPPVVHALRAAYDAATAPHRDDDDDVGEGDGGGGEPAPARLGGGNLNAAARRHARAAARDTDTGPGRPVVGVADGRPLALDLARSRGLGLVGPGTAAAIRALLVALLAERHRPDGGRVDVLIPAADARMILGEDAAARPPQRLHVAADLDAVLDHAETEILTRARLARAGPAARRAPPVLAIVAAPAPGRDRRLQAVLDNGSPLGVVGILYGQWRPGATVRVRPDGAVGAVSPNLSAGPLLGSRLFTLGPDDAGDLLDLLRAADAPAAEHEAWQEADPDPGPGLPGHPPRPGSESGSGSGGRAPLGWVPDVGGAPAGRAAETGRATGTDGVRPADPGAATGGTGDGGPSPVRPRTPPLPAAPTPPQAGPDGPAAGPGRTRPDPGPAEPAGPAAGLPKLTPDLRRTRDEPPQRPPPGGAAAAPFAFTVLGALRLAHRPAGRDRHVPVRGVTRKGREVLAYLAVHPDGARREAITAALWPAVGDERRLANRLHAALSQTRAAVRAATGGALGGVTESAEGRYRLRADLVAVDLWQVRAALDRHRCAAGDDERRAALLRLPELYTGELAEELTGRWASGPRETIHLDVVDALEALVRVLDDDLPRRLAVLERLRVLDPHNEGVYRDIARTQVRLGRRDAVARTFSLLTAALAEIEERPSPDTAAFFDALRRPGATDRRGTRSA
jgi:DNA-binding SARP family transcriptional activator